MSNLTQKQPTETIFEDIDLLADDAGIEFYQDLEFVLWLDNEAVDNE